MKTKSINSKAGFTLLEILLVVGIIAILAGIVILAINPTKQLGDTRNAQRRSDVLTILNAMYQFAIDHNGAVPTVDTSGTCDSDATDAFDLFDDLVGSDSTYLTAIPVDPSTGTPGSTSMYFVTQDPTSSRVTVCAPDSVGEGSIPSDGDQISVTR